MSFEIVTDSSANLLESFIEESNLHIIPLSFYIEEKEYRSYAKDTHTDLQMFYTMMREGKVVTTSLPHLNEAEAIFREVLDRGSDLLYIGFSSGLSGTYEAIELLLKSLEQEYPEQAIRSVDTLGASLGEGLLVYYAVKMQAEGSTIDEVAQWVVDNRLHLAHWFTVDDLMYLFRGGRVSRSSAWAANLLNIKPVLHMDDEGHLIPMEKVRGRKKSIASMFKHMQESAIKPIEDQVVFISHGDCLKDAQLLESMVRKEWNVKDVVINYVDPVIGAHSGPGTLALFFLATER